jgi:hypothetical protein
VLVHSGPRKENLSAAPKLQGHPVRFLDRLPSSQGRRQLFAHINVPPSPDFVGPSPNRLWDLDTVILDVTKFTSFHLSARTSPGRKLCLFHCPVSRRRPQTCQTTQWIEPMLG